MEQVIDLAARHLGEEERRGVWVSLGLVGEQIKAVPGEGSGTFPGTENKAEGPSELENCRGGVDVGGNISPLNGPVLAPASCGHFQLALLWVRGWPVGMPRFPYEIP